MIVSSSGLALMKGHEGCRLKAYLCSAGVWTIGYGHTRGVKEGDTCTQRQADDWLLEDSGFAEKAVNDEVKVSLTQNQFDALVSFVYNVGVGRRLTDPKGPAGFLGSTLLRKLNAGDYTGAADEFSKWVRGGGKILNGLVARRADERALFLTGVGV